MQKSSGGARKKGSSAERKQLLWGYIFIGPAIIGFLCFSLGPILFSLFLSFFKWNVITPMEFVGAGNYTQLMGDSLVWQSLKVTGLYSLLAVPLTTVISFFTSALLNNRVKGISLFRTIFYIPSIVPAVAVAAVWRYIYDPMYGLFNSVLRLVGLPTSNWIYSKSGVVPSLAIIAVWAAGNTVVIYLAGLQGISRQLYEAADIDGAGPVSKFRHITVPIMSPIIFYNVVMSIISCMQNFTLPYIMSDTKGGPDNASLFYSMLLYRTAFKNSQMGYAAAMSWLLFLIIAILTVVIFKTSDRWVFYESGDRS